MSRLRSPLLSAAGHRFSMKAHCVCDFVVVLSSAALHSYMLGDLPRILFISLLPIGSDEANAAPTPHKKM